MAPDAASAATPVPEIILDRIPVARMWIYSQAGPGAVAGQTDIAVAVARLAGLKVAPRLPGMLARPGVDRHYAARMAGLALGGIEQGMIGADAGELDILELAAMGEKLQAGPLEFAVALAAVLLIMAAIAALGVVDGFDRMDLEPVAAVTLRNVVMLVVLRR